MQKRFMTLPAMVASLLLVLTSLSAVTVRANHENDDADHAFANEYFERTWARTDEPVASGRVQRTWMWGPEPFTPQMFERYDDSPGDRREVQYFDKSRMEINCPVSAPQCADVEVDSPWYVTNGLLVVEMVEGHYQVGDTEFDESPQPAAVNVTGDPGDESGLSPTYADINRYELRDQPATPIGTPLTWWIDGEGNITQGAQPAGENVTAAHRVTVPRIDHTIASVFWTFMNSTGMVYENGQFVTENLFENPFYATGYPITEAYWSNVMVEGTERAVLWQCFERRCLTYTPGNPTGFLVEAGNVGQHYYRWRYGDEMEMATIYLVAEGDAGQSGIGIGCDDSLIDVQVEVPVADTVEGRITEALNKLFNLGDEPTYGESGLMNPFYQSDLMVESIEIDGDTVTVNLTGTLVIGGECDEPRVSESIRYSVLGFDDAFTTVNINLNGQPLFGGEQETEMATIFLIAEGDNGQTGDPIGCEDSIVPVQVEVPAADTLEGRIAAALTALFTLGDEREYGESGLTNIFYQSNVTVQSVTVEDGHATVNLTGTILIGGECDEPRVVESIRYTVLAFEGVNTVTVLFNGSPLFTDPDDGELTGGVLATFAVGDEQFKLWTTNETTIEQLFALQAGESQANIPNGPLLLGPGVANHNAPWSWHFDPEQTEMAEVTIELCDGTPSYVEENLDEWMEQVGRYCPWSAELVSLEDFRDADNGSETES
jgi:hypothetical protein